VVCIPVSAGIFCFNWKDLPAPAAIREPMKIRTQKAVVLSMAIALTAVGPTGEAQGMVAPGFSSADAIEQRLSELREERDRLGPGADAERIALLNRLEVALLQHREALDYLGWIEQQAESLRQTLSGWRGLDAPAPYTVQFAGQLRAERESLERQLRATQSRLRVVSQLIEETTDALAQNESTVRRLQEEAGLADSAKTRQEAEAMALREEIASRISAEKLARLQLRHDAQEIQTAALTAALELADLKIGAAKGEVRFMPGEMQNIQQRLQREREKTLAEVLDASRRGGTADRQIAWKVDILDVEEQFWNALYRAYNSSDKADRGAAVSRIKALAAQLDDWVRLIQLHARGEMDTESHTVGVRATSEDVTRVTGLQDQVRFALQDLSEEGMRGPALLDRVWSTLQAVWGAELYLAEETASVAGEKVTTYRAVTLGKLLRLAFIVAVGWYLLRLLSWRVHAFVTKRPGVEPGLADTVRSWTFGVGLTLLLLWGLNRVHIPVTAFAFLGGTLAIGIGFGAQTLLKNFISGIILGIERPFKVGDLVVVDDITGYIRRIGLRASVIEHFDGTDTLVPNSALLENRVSNWTYGNSAMRGEVEVGVAYGSRTRDVSRALLAVADGHGLVLENPEPTVQFTSFSDNTLVFKLLYWYDASRTRSEPLASDLRYMIDKAFAEAGIVIAFPQRDIHFDEGKPLRIELSRAARSLE
jgi:small-conductance mechanosensitive channel